MVASPQHNVSTWAAVDHLRWVLNNVGIKHSHNPMSRGRLQRWMAAQSELADVQMAVGMPPKREGRQSRWRMEVQALHIDRRQHLEQAWRRQEVSSFNLVPNQMIHHPLCLALNRIALQSR